MFASLLVEISCILVPGAITAFWAGLRAIGDADDAGRLHARAVDLDDHPPGRCGGAAGHAHAVVVDPAVPDRRGDPVDLEVPRGIEYRDHQVPLLGREGAGSDLRRPSDIDLARL